MHIPSTIDPQELRWLFRDKYQWSEVQIDHVLKGEGDLTDQQQKDIARLAKGEPLAYVIGWVKFLDCHINLEFTPLIPRPETEDWVENLLKEKRNWQAQPWRILDLCCGSGCIGIAVGKYLKEKEGLKNFSIDFVDISPRAIQQTAKNLAINEVSDHAKVIQSDLFTQLPNPTYDLILSNPPYVDPSGKFSASLAWEPKEALFAQNNGLMLIEKIIFNLKKCLGMGGEAYIEFGKGQENAIEKMLQTADLKKYEFHRDQFDVVRTVKISND